MRWEIAYGLQRRVDDRRAQAPAKFIGPLLNWLATTGRPTLLGCSETNWRAEARAALGSRGTADGFLHFTFEVLADLTDGTGWETEYPRDVWRLRHLGVTETRTARLHFDRISQPWLRELAKRWTRWRLTTGGSLSVAGQGVGALARLSAFLQAVEPGMSGPADLTRPVLERFLAFLAERPLIAKTRGGIASMVGAFLRHVRQHGWAPDLAPTAVIYPDDIPRRPSMESRALSEHLMAQLESPRNLKRFAEPDLRLITEILMRTGLRAGDACQLPADCITRDRAGAAYLRYVNHKMRRDAILPIDEELATAIHAQIDRVRRRWPTATCLFPRQVSNPDGTRPLGYSTYRMGLTRWLAACDIQDESGQPAHVTPHQWRHTYGSRMVNADVPLHIVKQLLDHSSDTMTAHYARLNQTTVRRHWEQARRVNIAGQPVPLDATSPLADAEWVKENVARAKMALPNGLCTLPLQKSCAHANACLTCPLFVTTAEFLPEHRRQLEATRTLITSADSNGHARLAESNRTVERNLLRIIDALDVNDQDCCNSSADRCDCRRKPVVTDVG